MVYSTLMLMLTLTLTLTIAFLMTLMLMLTPTKGLLLASMKKKQRMKNSSRHATDLQKLCCW
jgi:hypothetical protein